MLCMMTNVLLADIKTDALLADKAHDSDKRDKNSILNAQDIEAVILVKSSHLEPVDHSKQLCKAQHLIENFSLS